MLLKFFHVGSSTPSKASSAKAIPKRITVAHIMKTVNEVYGSKVTGLSASSAAMPLQQKLAVCSLVLSLKQVKSKEVTIGKVSHCIPKRDQQKVN